MSTATIEARMTHPVYVIPNAMEALLALTKSTKGKGLPRQTVMLVHLRASQINGCAWCVDMHARELKESGASDERIWGVAAWRESPYFSDAERAALTLTEAATRLSDQADPVPDEIWDDAARQYDETSLSALLLEIAAINAWNRLNVTTRQPAGTG